MPFQARTVQLIARSLEKERKESRGVWSASLVVRAWKLGSFLDPVSDNL